MRSPRNQSPRNLTKSQQIAEAALQRHPSITPEVTPRLAEEYPEVSPRLAEEYPEAETLNTPGRSVNPPLTPSGEVAASRAGTQTASSSSQRVFEPPSRLPDALQHMSQKHEPNLDNYSDGFEAPAEATPMTRKEVRPVIPGKEKPPSEAPTSSHAPTSMHTKDQDYNRRLVSFHKTPAEFEEFLKDLPFGQRMRVQERIAHQMCLNQTGDAIRAITESADQPIEIWEAAAQWQLPHLPDYENERYLSTFGYKLANARRWSEAPSATGIHLELSVGQHISRAGHNWYNVKCKLSGLPNDIGCVEWVAPRRLGQLRMDLHHLVKSVLGSETYEEKFHLSRFAKYGGPPGTTARLHAWLGTLADLINQGVAQPSVAIIVLVFFGAPLPEGMVPPGIATGTRFSGNANFDEHSQLGGKDMINF